MYPMLRGTIFIKSKGTQQTALSDEGNRATRMRCDTYYRGEYLVLTHKFYSAHY